MTEGPDAFAPQPARWDLVASPRLTARAAVREDLSIKGSAGRYVRLPTLVELFGDRGVIVGTPGLRAERGTSLDLGAVWAPDRALGRFDRIFVEAAGFATRTHDTIAFVMTAGYAARAINIADAQSYGAELVASTRIAKRVSLTANYTHLSTEQLSPEVSFDGKSLPRQPTHSVYARAEVAADRATLWLDGSYQSIAFLDQGNFQRVPARLLAGTGARVSLTSDLAVSLAVENLADTRIEYLPLDRPPRPDLANVPTALADVAGFPLPGRTLYVSLDWSHR